MTTAREAAELGDLLWEEEYLAFDRDEDGNPINVRPVNAEPIWEDDKIVGYVVAAPPVEEGDA